MPLPICNKLLKWQEVYWTFPIFNLILFHKNFDSMAGKVKNNESWQLIHTSKWTNYYYSKRKITLLIQCLQNLMVSWYMEFFLKRVKQNKFEEHSTWLLGLMTMYCFFPGKCENVLWYIPRNERYLPTLNSLINEQGGIYPLQQSQNRARFWIC